MPLCPPDMNVCTPKTRCSRGPNEGQVYDPEDPCCGSGFFDAWECDCVCHRYRFTTTMWIRGYTYTPCNEEPVTQPYQAYTEIWVAEGPRITIGCVDYEWTNFGSGYIADDAAVYYIYKDITCNEPESPGQAISDFTGVSRCYEEPYSACETYYFTLDLLEVQAENENGQYEWQIVPGPY